MANLFATASAVGDSQVVSAPTLPASVNSPAAPDVATVVKVVALSTPPAEPAKEPSITEVKHAARQLEQFMESMNRYLEFRIDQDSGRTIVTVKDKTTGETVRQIPTEEVLRLAQNLGGTGNHALVNQTA